jgi:hypothetical protein
MCEFTPFPGSANRKEHLGPRRAYAYQQQGSRPVEEVLESMRANLWTLPAGAKSSLELLREDRDFRR